MKEIRRHEERRRMKETGWIEIRGREKETWIKEIWWAKVIRGQTSKRGIEMISRVQKVARTRRPKIIRRKMKSGAQSSWVKTKVKTRRRKTPIAIDKNHLPRPSRSSLWLRT